MFNKRTLHIASAILLSSAAASLVLPAGAAPPGNGRPAVDRPAQWAAVSSYASGLQDRLSKDPRFGGMRYTDEEARRS